MTVPYLDDILSMYVYACACAFFATAGGLLCSVTSIAMGSQAHTERGCSIYICRSIFPCSISYIASVIHELYTALLTQDRSQNSVVRL